MDSGMDGRLAPLLILLTSLNPMLLSTTRSSCEHIPRCLLQELVRFTGHPEATEGSLCQHFISYSVSFPPLHIRLAANHPSTPHFLLLFKAQADKKTSSSLLTFFFPIEMEIQLAGGLCRNGQD